MSSGGRVGGLFVVAALLLGSTGAAHAAACSAFDISGSGGDALVAGSPGFVDTTDMTFRGNAADGCSALYLGNTSHAETQAIATGLGWGSFDDPGLKAESGTPPTDTASYGGIFWTLSYDASVNPNTWVLSYQADPDLVRTFDMVATLKQATGWAAFLFAGETFATDGFGSGTFNINWCKDRGELSAADCSMDALSHMAIYFGERSTQVSAPAPLLLLAFGLAAFGVTRRRRG